MDTDGTETSSSVVPVVESHPIHRRVCDFISKLKPDQEGCIVRHSLQETVEFEKEIELLIEEDKANAKQNELSLFARLFSCPNKIFCACCSNNYYYYNDKNECREDVTFFDHLSQLLYAPSTARQYDKLSFSITLQFEEVESKDGVASCYDHMVKIFERLLSLPIGGDKTSSSSIKRKLSTDQQWLKTIVSRNLDDDYNVVKAMISNGVDFNVNVRCRSGLVGSRQTYMQRFLQWNRNPETLRLLLEHGVATKFSSSSSSGGYEDLYEDDEKTNALGYLLDLDMAKTLILHDASMIKQVCQLGLTPFVDKIRDLDLQSSVYQLIFTICFGCSDDLRSVLTLPDKFGTTPLMHLAMNIGRDHSSHMAIGADGSPLVNSYKIFEYYLKDLGSDVDLKHRNHFGFSVIVCLWWRGFSHLMKSDRDKVYYPTRKQFDCTNVVKAVKHLISLGAPEPTKEDLRTIRLLASEYGYHHHESAIYIADNDFEKDWQMRLDRSEPMALAYNELWGKPDFSPVEKERPCLLSIKKLHIQ